MGMNASIRNKDIFDHFIFINLYLYTLQQYIYDDEHAFMMNMHIWWTLYINNTMNDVEQSTIDHHFVYILIDLITISISEPMYGY